jgi:HPt (histidine-containing phosphotransfer) domain-containing protein
MSYIFPDQDLDLSFLYEIADGSNEFIVESIDMFLEHTPEMLQTITKAIADNDWALVGSTAHKLKPNLGFFGMPVSQATLQEIEIITKGGVPDRTLLLSKFNEVKAIIVVNFITLKKIKAELEAGL